MYAYEVGILLMRGLLLEGSPLLLLLPPLETHREHPSGPCCSASLVAGPGLRACWLPFQSPVLPCAPPTRWDTQRLLYFSG